MLIKMTRVCSIFLVLKFGMFSTNVGADELSDKDSVNFYLGFKGGYSVSSNQCIDKNCENSSPYFATLAGYNFGKWGSAEIEYGDILSKNDNYISKDSSISYYALKYKNGYDFGNNSIFANAGLALWEQNFTSVDSGSRHIYDVSSLVGFGYERKMPSNNLRFRLGYDYINGVGGKKTNENLFSISVVYDFKSHDTYIGNSKHYSYINTRNENRRNAVDDFKITSSKVCFDFDSSKFSDYYGKILESFYKEIPKNTSLQMIGFADRRGTVDYNFKLVNRRNKSVEDYLIKLDSKEGKIKEIRKINNSNIDIRYTKSELNRCTELFILSN
ncbi:OmpA family protein [Vibrio mediterranei]